MSYLNFINLDLFSLSDKQRVSISPNISLSKIKNASDKFGVLPENILVIIDDSLFNNGKSGCVITDMALYFRKDFDNPRVYNLWDIRDITVKKSFTGSTKIYINDKKVMTLEQANFSEVEYLLYTFLEYMLSLVEDDVSVDENLTEDEIDDEIDTFDSSLEEENNELKRQIAELQRELDRKQQYDEEDKHKEDNEVNKMLSGIGEQCKESPKHSLSALRVHQIDNTIKGLRHLRDIKTRAALGVVDFVSFVLNPDDISKQLREQMKGSIADISIYIRDKYIDEPQIIELQNDFMMNEIIILTSSMICNELLNRGISKNKAISLISEGLLELFPGYKLEKYRQYIIQCIIFSENAQNEALQAIFYTRSLISNLNGKLSGINFIEDIMDSKNDFILNCIDEVKNKINENDQNVEFNNEEELLLFIVEFFSYKAKDLILPKMGRDLMHDDFLNRKVRFSVDNLLNLLHKMH